MQLLLGKPFILNDIEKNLFTGFLYEVLTNKNFLSSLMHDDTITSFSCMLKRKFQILLKNTIIPLNLSFSD